MESSEEIIPTICGICESGCGVNAHLRDGRLVKVTPLKNHPRGIVCTRGAASAAILYSPDRLQHPLKRVGKKGEGQFERLSWDEALDQIATKILEIKEEYGPQAVAEYSGRGGGFEQSLRDIFGIRGVSPISTKSFLFPLGSPNATGCCSLCAVAYGKLAPRSTLGADMRQMFPDYAHSDLIVVWGANPATDSPPLVQQEILKAKGRGASVVVIDHLRTPIARAADQWIPIRPGTDGALALGLMHVLVSEGLYDRQFVDRWTVGFEELRSYVAGFTPEAVEQITRVPRSAIISLARKLGVARGASLCSYTGLEYTNSGVQNIRAVLILWAISGNLEVPGGIAFRMPGKLETRRVLLDPPPTKAIGADRYPIFYRFTKSAQFMELPRAVLKGEPYPIKGLILDGASIITGYPDPALWRRTFLQLEHLVVIDRFLTADALYADYVLPAMTFYEMTSYHRFPDYVQLRQKITEPRGEARNDYHIYVDLARRLGYGDLFPEPEETLVEYVLKDSGITMESLRREPAGIRVESLPMVYRKYERGMLRKDGRPGFETPSGKVEITSRILAEEGYEALPVYREPVEGPIAAPATAEKYPLVLNTGARIMSSFRSQHLNIPRLLALQPRARVLINPRDAETRGIRNGDVVEVLSPRGAVRMEARVTEDILPGVVEANAGGGGPIQDEGWKDANVNVLTDPDNRDPISGFPVLKALLCEVVRV